MAKLSIKEEENDLNVYCMEYMIRSSYDQEYVVWNIKYDCLMVRNVEYKI